MGGGTGGLGGGGPSGGEQYSSLGGGDGLCRHQRPVAPLEILFEPLSTVAAGNHGGCGRLRMITVGAGGVGGG
jgi:hypothetical protein